YVARKKGAVVRCEPRSLGLQVEKSIEPGLSRGVFIRLSFLGASETVAPRGVEPMPGRTNYLRGNDPGAWRTDVPSFARVVYADVYPGVDLLVRESGGPGVIEYDVRLRPGARLEDVRFSYGGIDGLSLDEEGALVVATAMGRFRQTVPRTWEEAASGDARSV